MDYVLEKAEERLRTLDLEAVRLREFIATYRELVGPDEGESGRANIAHNNVVENAGGVESRKASAKEVVDAAERFISERMRPMTRTELVSAMDENGIVIGGTDKSKNMGTIIWRSKRFTNIDGEGYWPVDLPEWAPEGEVSNTGYFKN